MYRIETFDQEGLTPTSTKVVGERSSEVAVCVRKALNLPNVTEVELHKQDGTSVAYRLAR